MNKGIIFIVSLFLKTVERDFQDRTNKWNALHKLYSTLSKYSIVWRFTFFRDEIKKGLKTGTPARMIVINLSSQKVSKY